MKDLKAEMQQAKQSQASNPLNSRLLTKFRARRCAVALLEQFTQMRVEKNQGATYNSS